MKSADQLIKIINRNDSARFILEHADKLKIQHWYLGGGGITQTVWNVLHGFNPEYGIKDYDLIYFDSSDISYEAEDVVIQRTKELFRDIPIDVEVRNQARVHLWYQKRFGHTISAHQSTEAAIDTWPTTATALGVRSSGGQCHVYSAFGLDDLFDMVVRANKRKITKEIYEDKVSRWIGLWPKLTVIPWDE